MWGAAVPSRSASPPSPSSTPSRATRDSDAIAYSYSQAGHEFYVLTFPTADVTWCYDLATGHLAQAGVARPETGIYHRHRSQLRGRFQRRDYRRRLRERQSMPSRNRSSRTTGDPLPCVRRCPHLTSDLKRQFFSTCRFSSSRALGFRAGRAQTRSSSCAGRTMAASPSATITSIKIGKPASTRTARSSGAWATRETACTRVEVTDPVYRVGRLREPECSVGAN
jgi:hypothetical protein